MTPDVLAGILPRVYPQMLAVVREHQDAGRRCYIATAASQPAAEILAQALVMDGAMGTCWEIGTASTPGGSTARSRTARARPSGCASSPPTGDRPGAVLGLHRCGLGPADAGGRRPPGRRQSRRGAGRGRAARGWEVLRFEKLGRAAAGGGRGPGRAAVGGSGSWLARARRRRPPRVLRGSHNWAMAVEPEAMRRAHEWLKEVYARQPERDALFTTISGEPVSRSTPQEDLAETDPERDIGYPGEYPFTRGVYPSMYRGRLWTMRQFAGFGTAEETNERFRYLLEHGQTGLSTAFDMPTLMGHDSDSHALGGRGRARGRRDRHARRHGDAVRRHPAGRGHHVDDDQRAGRDPARVLRVRGRASRGCRATSSAARSRPTS